MLYPNGRSSVWMSFYVLVLSRQVAKQPENIGVLWRPGSIRFRSRTTSPLGIDFWFRLSMNDTKSTAWQNNDIRAVAFVTISVPCLCGRPFRSYAGLLNRQRGIPEVWCHISITPATDGTHGDDHRHRIDGIRRRRRADDRLSVHVRATGSMGDDGGRCEGSRCRAVDTPRLS